MSYSNACSRGGVLCLKVWKLVSLDYTAAILGYVVFVIPAKAGIQGTFLSPLTFWIPAFAGMTLENYVSRVGFGIGVFADRAGKVS